jgi:hypothetical protein
MFCQANGSLRYGRQLHQHLGSSHGRDDETGSVFRSREVLG